MTPGTAPLTTRVAGMALEAHFLRGREVHPRKLSPGDRKRSERMTLEALRIHCDCQAYFPSGFLVRSTGDLTVSGFRQV